MMTISGDASPKVSVLDGGLVDIAGAHEDGSMVPEAVVGGSSGPSAPRSIRVEMLKVSGKSHPTAVAGAIAGVIRGQGVAEIQVVGAGALNQAIKAIAVARGFLAEAGLDLVCTPSFAIVDIDGESRTAMRLVLDDRSRRQLPAADAVAALP